MGEGVTRLDEIASQRLQAQRLYRAGMDRIQIMNVLRVTKGQLSNFLLGMPANSDIRSPVSLVVPIHTPKREAADPALYIPHAKLCRPCARRVLPSEVRACLNNCALKRMGA